MPRLCLIALAFQLLVCVPSLSTAAPVNLLENPGFETGDFGGWTISGNSSAFGVAFDQTAIDGSDITYLPNFVNVRSGNWAGWALVRDGLGPVDRLLLSQTVSVRPNTNVDVGFWLGNDSASGFGASIDDAHLQITIDNVGILPPKFLNNISPGNTSVDFTEVSSHFNTGPRTSIHVQFSINASGTGIAGASFDDFFFITEPVPEPCSLSLTVIAAFGGAVVIHWRRNVKIGSY